MECTRLLEMLQLQFTTYSNTTISVIVDNNGIITDGDIITVLINLNLTDNKEWKTTLRLFYSSGLVVDIADQLKLSKML